MLRCAKSLLAEVVDCLLPWLVHPSSHGDLHQLEWIEDMHLRKPLSQVELRLLETASSQ
jgi:hypothetical protein